MNPVDQYWTRSTSFVTVKGTDGIEKDVFETGCTLKAIISLSHTHDGQPVGVQKQRIQNDQWTTRLE